MSEDSGYTEKEAALQDYLDDQDLGVINYLLSKVSFDKETWCWNWKGYATPLNYGQMQIEHRTYYTHRVSYTIFKGMIYHDRVIDHLCHNKLCCNPDHLEMVTRAENTRRSQDTLEIFRIRSHCDFGHEMTNKNTTKDYKCRICLNKRNRLEKFRRSITVDWMSN